MKFLFQKGQVKSVHGIQAIKSYQSSLLYISIKKRKSLIADKQYTMHRAQDTKPHNINISNSRERIQ